MTHSITLEITSRKAPPIPTTATLTRLLCLVSYFVQWNMVKPWWMFSHKPYKVAQDIELPWCIAGGPFGSPRGIRQRKPCWNGPPPFWTSPWRNMSSTSQSSSMFFPSQRLWRISTFFSRVFSKLFSKNMNDWKRSQFFPSQIIKDLLSISHGIIVNIGSRSPTSLCNNLLEKRRGESQDRILGVVWERFQGEQGDLVILTQIILDQWWSGWWLTYPSEKYESQLGWLFPIYGKIKHVPNHQPVINVPL